ncbi:L-seryl-tRNA(Sec) selenium transferase [Thermodesulfobacteriota bacterium]
MAADKKQALFRKIPAVDRLLMEPVLEDALNNFPKGLVMRALNHVLSELRGSINEGKTMGEEELKTLRVAERVVEKLAEISMPSLRPVINATGVVVHTNLGRSILGKKILQKFGPLAGGYSNLEYDLNKGERGSRYVHVEDILKELTSAEAAMVVNNNAAAVLLSLETLAKGGEVIVSRGQLVEIGGSFRIPDVMRKSGANMVEVGTTNKTHLRDYEAAIGPDTSLLLKVHTSNYQILGFTEEVPLADLVNLGRKHGIPVMEDLGSGSFLDFSEYGLTKEPTVQEALQAGSDLITFSGDKLLGGPQAGIILGRKDLVEAIKSNQFARALRIDKLTLLALEETLRLYRDETSAIKEIPTLNMICQPYKELAKKAHKLKKMLGEPPNRHFSVELMDGSSRVGGGALPAQELPTKLLCLVPHSLTSHFIESWLRSYDPPVITRIEKERIILDVRTIPDRDLKTAAQAIKDLAALE